MGLAAGSDRALRTIPLLHFYPRLEEAPKDNAPLRPGVPDAPPEPGIPPVEVRRVFTSTINGPCEGPFQAPRTRPRIDRLDKAV